MSTADEHAYLGPEDRARVSIDGVLRTCGWQVQQPSQVNLHAGRGVAVRSFQLSGGDEADYLLFVDAQAVGVLEAKQAGTTLTGVEPQSAKYADELPDHVQAPFDPLPFLYESTGVETQFTNLLDPVPRSRRIFAFHRPETLAAWVHDARSAHPDRPTLRHRLQAMPALDDSKLWGAQAKAIRHLEQSLAENRPRALIQMATGSGKTYTAANFTYRLIKHAKARRVLFLVDRANLGEQAEREFSQFVGPDVNRRFTELHNVQRLVSNQVPDSTEVVITTIQRLYSILRGDADLEPELDERSAYEVAGDEPVEVAYNPDFPIEMFDVIVIDECHRSIFGVWRQVLDYFDAFLVGLTATPTKQTLGFFNRNLVMSYNHEDAVADGVNVDFEVYRIRTSITEHGGHLAEGDFAYVRDKQTRAERWERLDEDVDYEPDHLDRKVIAEDQIRTVVCEFRDKLFTDIFPGRSVVPKTLVFAKDDSHADDIVRVIREEFAAGNDFCQKITYRTRKPDEVLAEFRNAVNPRIAVTVDMVATGTDVKPLECVFFMRAVKSRTFFEQMKGRGVRVISDTDYAVVTPHGGSKTHFVIVDALGATETTGVESQPLERKRHVSLDKLLEQVAYGSTDPDVLSSLGSRLTRLDHQLSEQDRAALRDTAGGVEVADIAGALLRAVDPDHQTVQAIADGADPDSPEPERVQQAAEALVADAVRPLAANPELRRQLVDTRQDQEQYRDVTSEDSVIDSGHSRQATDQARQIVADWQQFIEDHRDQLTALQVLYNRPYREQLTYDDVKELAQAIQRPPRRLTPDRVWHAYQQLESSRVRASSTKMLTDLVSLVRFTLEQDAELRPYKEIVNERFERWLTEQEEQGRHFGPEQREWLERMREVIAGSLAINADDFDGPPLSEHGGLGRAYQVFGDELTELMQELSEELVV